MIQMLGVGIERPGGGWLLHRVCVRVPPACLAVVVSHDPAERHALLDAVAGRVIPDEGRLSVAGIALRGDSARRVRLVAAEVDLRGGLSQSRTVRWNALAVGGPGLRAALPGLLRVPRPHERQAALRALGWLGLESQAGERAGALELEARARVAVARVLARSPEVLLLRDPDTVLGLADAEIFLRRLASVVRTARLTAVVTLAEPALADRLGDRVIALADGVLVYDGAPAGLTEAGGGWRLMAPARV